MTGVNPSKTFLNFCIVAACVLLAAFLLACGGDDTESSTSERMLVLEAKAHSLEESLESRDEENEALRSEVAALRSELSALQQAQAEFVQEQEAAKAAKEHEEEVADFEEVQEEQLAALEQGQARTEQRLDELDDRLLELESAASRIESLLSLVESWSTDKDQKKELSEKTERGSVLERTAALAEDSGGAVYYIDLGEPEERAILVMPPEPIDGNPLIVSLHGYGSNSAYHSDSFPLHRQVVSRGFGLLLPNGTPDGSGNQSWNPTDQVGSTGKASGDDFAYLVSLVARAKELKDFGPVYVFGYSNGGFMAYWMACKGLPGLRAVASLAGTSYFDDSECEGAPPVSVLHIHGSADDVIMYGGDTAEPVLEADTELAAYASAQEMVMRWGNRAGCEWPKTSAEFAHYAVLDLDMFVRGPETYAYRLESGCADGIDIHLWQGVQSGHAPGYLHAFLEALLDWLLAQE